MRTLPKVLMTCCLLASCTSAPSQEVSTPSPTVPAPDALTFGGIVLPKSAQILGQQHDGGIDERYRIVLRVAPNEVATLLSGSGFFSPLTPDTGPFEATVDGFDLSNATNVISADDTLAPRDDRQHPVSRQIVVDRSDPTKSVVHLRFFSL